MLSRTFSSLKIRLKARHCILLAFFLAVLTHPVLASVWHIETVDSGGTDTSIALDSNDHPHISYYRVDSGDLKYAYYDGSSWHIETVDGYGWWGGNVGWFTSIALDSNDYPHISYHDYSNGDLKYAKMVNKNPIIDSFTANPSWFNTTKRNIYMQRS